MNLEKFTQIAYSMVPADRPQFFHVAGIFLKGRPVSIATNSFITHPLTLKYNYHPNSLTHAELKTVIRGRREDYSGYTIAVLRIDRNGKLNMSKPCNGCMSVILNLNFKYLYYTTKLGIWEKAHVRNLHLQS